MAKKKFEKNSIERTGYALKNTNTEARQARRELRKATRGMTEEEAYDAITASDELSDLATTALRKPGNKTGPREQGMSKHEKQKKAYIESQGMVYVAPEKNKEPNIDGKARKAIRTRQEFARGVEVVVAMLKMQDMLRDHWEFRSGAPDAKVSIGAKSGHKKLRGVFEAVKGIPSLPRSALSNSGESVVLQRNGDPKDTVSIPCLSDGNMAHRGARRQLSQQESQGIEKIIGIHPSDLIDEYIEKFGPLGMN